MGPLQGIKVVEIAGIGPGPMCAMLLADMGATVLRVDRQQKVEQGIARPLAHNILLRNRRSIALDLKNPPSVDFVLELVEQADGLIEGFRAGVMERLGLGPDVCLARNPALVYGRMTGWGQTGPLANAIGHDMNYIALTGALHAIGRRGQLPSPPLNLVGDYAGGALYLAMGMLAAMLDARTSGRGQTVDAAIVDGTASLMSAAFGLYGAGLANLARGDNVLDSGAYFYDVYECADGLLVSVAAIESHFHDDLLRRMDLDPADFSPQNDRSMWPRARAKLAARFKAKTRAEWCKVLEGHTCFAPVLTMEEAPAHPHMVERETFINVEGVVQPAPAPRFGRTTAKRPFPPQPVDTANTDLALQPWVSECRIAQLRESRILDR